MVQLTERAVGKVKEIMSSQEPRPTGEPDTAIKWRSASLKSPTRKSFTGRKQAGCGLRVSYGITWMWVGQIKSH